MSSINDLILVWGSPADIEMKSDGGGEYASAFRLTPRGIAKIAQALKHPFFRDAEFCGCDDQREGDGIHVAGEPVEMICLASPLAPEPHDSTTGARPGDEVDS